MSKTSKSRQEKLLPVIRAAGIAIETMTMRQLCEGFATLQVLTYSNDLELLREFAEIFDDVEIIFGRHDIIQRGISCYAYEQNKTLKGLIAEITGSDLLRERVKSEKIRLYTLRDLISHEKLYLLSTETHTRVISTSANFSGRGFSGVQNEGVVVFDDDPVALEYAKTKYANIKQASDLIQPQLVVANKSKIKLADLPLLSDHGEDSVKVIVLREIAEASSQRIIDVRVPREYEYLDELIKPEQGAYRIDKATRARVVQYEAVINQNKGEAASNDEYLSINLDNAVIDLCGDIFSLEVTPESVRHDLELMVQYFDGYKKFGGNVQDLVQSYWAFWCWNYASPFICDLRNRAQYGQSGVSDPKLYPAIAILYGKSQCGKSTLIQTLMQSMFGMSRNYNDQLFTPSKVELLRHANRRFPLWFEDIPQDKLRETGKVIIKRDTIHGAEYPGIVISCNDSVNSLETELRRRCAIWKTTAAVGLYSSARRELAEQVQQIHKELGTAIYREYLRRAIPVIANSSPEDVYRFSSEILYGIFRSHLGENLPSWCRIITNEDYDKSAKDKIQQDLIDLWENEPAAFTVQKHKIKIRIVDAMTFRRLAKDIPSNVMEATIGNVMVLYRDQLEEFMGIDLFARRKSKFWSFLQR